MLFVIGLSDQAVMDKAQEMQINVQKSNLRTDEQLSRYPVMLCCRICLVIIVIKSRATQQS